MNSTELGYIIDFLAGFWIIQSIILRSQRHIEVESQQLWDGNPLLHETQLKSFWDGWMGVSQLLIGLIFHLWHFEINLYTGVQIILLFVLFSILIKKTLDRKIESKMKQIYPSSYIVVKARAKGIKES